MTTPAPPYGLLAAPAFPFPALASLAARAPLGETRETVLACLVAARLALATLPPYALTPEQRRQRAAAALSWLGALALPPDVRQALLALCEAAAAAAPAALHEALSAVVAVAAPALDEGACAELAALRRSLAGAEGAPTA